MSDCGETRRRFLVTSVTAVAAIGSAQSLLTGCGPAADNCPDAGTVVTASEVAIGGTVRPQGAAYVIARDSAGFYAYSNVCTHQGCTVPCPTAGISTCPCHGAQFDANGNNVRGPSGGGPVPGLPHYLVTFSGTGASAVVVVNTGVVLTDRNTRAMPLNFM
jgi:Rieske Fe-S protein